jgi:hypothetical protein
MTSKKGKWRNGVRKNNPKVQYITNLTTQGGLTFYNADIFNHMQGIVNHTREQLRTALASTQN